jgi:hypothetical protein
MIRKREMKGRMADSSVVKRTDGVAHQNIVECLANGR